MTRNLALIKLVLFCCLAVFAFSAQAQDSGANQWKRYELGKGNFNVLLPSQPKEDFRASPPNLELPIDVYIYSVETNEGNFVAQYSLLGEAAAKWAEGVKEHFYTGFWNGIVESIDKKMAENKLAFRTKLEEKRGTKFSGYDGQEILFTLGPYQGRMWTTLVGRQAFAAMVVGSEKISAADRQRFLDSFTVTLKPIPITIKTDTNR